MKMIPTNGKRPEGLKDEDLVWVQFHHASGRPTGSFTARAGLVEWFHVEAYCIAELPEPYVPEPDYSKWVGCLCWVWEWHAEDKKVRIFDKYNPGAGNPFNTAGGSVANCRPLTPKEIREFLKKAEEIAG